MEGYIHWYPLLIGLTLNVFIQTSLYYHVFSSKFNRLCKYFPVNSYMFHKNCLYCSVHFIDSKYIITTTTVAWGVCDGGVDWGTALQDRKTWVWFLKG